ncbi:hypothetical protein EWM64_g3583 [Hericium alpestre]|uniref:BTB domain-containing protein n=1 Tax=Hericium alpestre TaxID=135208 RepID=A0A4Y9ZZX2_9AGAM|nr:hypothetical protein EWM64_g3583 [Hericium alpestre]
MDVITPPPNKRCREDDVRIWTRHPDLWLTRGDIVISMFMTVDPSQNETYEGLSVVQLHDPADDMYHLLKAMHSRQYVRKTSQPGFKALAAILQLSTKYMIDDLREEAVDALTLIFPSSLAAWTDSKIHYLPPDLDAMYAVELAKQHDIPIILPAACHLASLRTARRISMTKKSRASNATRWTCAMFRDEFANVAYNALSNSRSKKDSRHVQRGAFGASEQKFQRLALNDIFSPALGRMHPKYKKICKALRSRVDQYWLTVQGKVWDALPSLCGYKDWAAVKTAQAAVAGSKA